MVRMDGALDRAGLSARMLMQMHDELVFEAPDDQVEAPEPAVKLGVPLAVEARAARNWDEAH